MYKITKQKIALCLALLAVLCLFQGCAALFVGTAATTAAVAQDRRTTGTIIEDKTIQFKAMQAIHEVGDKNPKLHVAAVSYNARVLLVGQAPSQKIRSDIESRVKDIEKIGQVHNEIVLTAPSTLMQRTTDSWITTKIKSEMALTKDLNPTRVKVITENGIVYLMGIVNAFEEDITVDIARHTKGVKKVVKIFEYEK